MLLRKRKALTADCCACGGGARSTEKSRRGWDIVAGAGSLGLFVITPKCPICLAVYVALWTGLGLSLTAAMYLRWSMLALSGNRCCCS